VQDAIEAANGGPRPAKWGRDDALLPAGDADVATLGRHRRVRLPTPCQKPDPAAAGRADQSPRAGASPGSSSQDYPGTVAITHDRYFA
jgi:hypothetical protein